MIEVRTKLLSKPSNQDLSGTLTVAAANGIAENMANTIKKHVKDKRCPTHNPGHGVITVVANKKKLLTVEKSGFCCKAFENSIEFTIT